VCVCVWHQWPWFIGSSLNTTCGACTADRLPPVYRRPPPISFHAGNVTESITKRHGGAGAARCAYVKNYCARSTDDVTGTPAITNRRRSVQTKIMNFSSPAGNRSILSCGSIGAGDASRSVGPSVRRCPAGRAGGRAECIYCAHQCLNYSSHGDCGNCASALWSGARTP